jgi:AbrB family looped-hinge helix DNA binding protein
MRIGARTRLTSKGQVTIPAALRERYDLREGEELDVVEDGSTPRIVRVWRHRTRGRTAIRRMRGRATPI